MLQVLEEQLGRRGDAVVPLRPVLLRTLADVQQRLTFRVQAFIKARLPTLHAAGLVDLGVFCSVHVRTLLTWYCNCKQHAWQPGSASDLRRVPVLACVRRLLQTHFGKAHCLIWTNRVICNDCNNSNWHLLLT